MSYRKAVEWIARNDNDGVRDDDQAIANYLTVSMVADLYGKEPIDVARDVMMFRREIGIRIGHFTDDLLPMF
jgi:hypothetical protein